MKNFIWIVFSLVLVTVAIIVFILFYNTKYEESYFAVVGLPTYHWYSKVKEVYGEPLKIEQDEEFKSYFTAQYDGIEFYCLKLADGDATVLSVHIYDSKIHFGKKEIGVGSTTKEINRAYWKVRKMSGPGCGYIDGSTWISFYFDENEIVNKIAISIGP